MPSTLFKKLWDLHRVTELGGDEHLIYIDRVFLHERTGSIALQGLASSQRPIRRPQQVFCTMDHIVDTFPGRGDATLMPSGADFILATREAANQAGINLFDIDDPNQGITHVVAAELGIALPGATIVCPDSHTCTLGGLGALAWGIGSTEAEHAMATNTLRVRKPKTMRVTFNGELQPGVTAKDLILKLISQYGAGGGAGYAVEFAGPVIEQLSVEARMTLCNMAVEFSAFTGFTAPDEATIGYLADRPYAPTGTAFEHAAEHWRTLYSDDGAVFDAELQVDCSGLKTMVTWGTSPEHAIAIDSCVPDPARETNPKVREGMEKALHYMDVTPGTEARQIKIDAAFIGSCTNSRLSDLRVAASYLKGKHVAPGVAAVCVPGSTRVKLAAEAEGLDKIFKEAGFAWRESGCSMCFYAGGETFGAGARVISSTNRNFEGRQGPGTRTHLASPATVAASACQGFISAASPAGQSNE
jgi:3-isopropylmalate/(R)-2-methylmalate dehydratase large subunit